MKGLECIVLVLILILIWKCCSKKSEKFGTAVDPYTPQIQTAAWMTKSPWLGFEDASTFQRTGTLLRRLGMDNAGGKENMGQNNDYAYAGSYLRNTNATGSFDQIRGY